MDFPPGVLVYAQLCPHRSYRPDGPRIVPFGVLIDPSRPAPRRAALDSAVSAAAVQSGSEWLRFASGR